MVQQVVEPVKSGSSGTVRMRTRCSVTSAGTRFAAYATTEPFPRTSDGRRRRFLEGADGRTAAYIRGHRTERPVVPRLPTAERDAR